MALISVSRHDLSLISNLELPAEKYRPNQIWGQAVARATRMRAGGGFIRDLKVSYFRKKQKPKRMFPRPLPVESPVKIVPTNNEVLFSVWNPPIRSESRHRGGTGSVARRVSLRRQHGRAHTIPAALGSLSWRKRFL